MTARASLGATVEVVRVAVEGVTLTLLVWTAVGAKVERLRVRTPGITIVAAPNLIRDLIIGAKTCPRPSLI